MNAQTRSVSDNERGASMVEYALLIVLIALIAFVAVEIGGQAVSDTFDTLADSLSNAGAN